MAARPGVDLLVVIVNFCTPSLAIDCLRSLADELADREDVAVVVVDNASPDGSVQSIAHAIQSERWDAWARVVALPVNRGYAAGNNAAIRDALTLPCPPFAFWLLNPDTRVRPGSLRALEAALVGRPQVGIVGSRLEDPDGTPQPSAFHFPSILDELERGLRLGVASRLLKAWRRGPAAALAGGRVDWVAGASMLVRREVFQSCGLLDENYFLYFEEVDLCRRARRAGFECWYTPDARVVHLVGRSTGLVVGAARPRRLPGYWFDSRRRYFVKQHGRAYALLADACWGLGFVTWRARRRLQHKVDSDPPHVLWDFWRHSAFVRGEPTCDSMPRL